jgi:hypothetical protein
MSDGMKTELGDLKLLDREQVTRILAPTENLNFTTIKPGAGTKILFRGDKDHPIMEIAGQPHEMDVDALETIAGCIGLQKGYTKKCPMNILVPALDYWYNDGLTKPIRVVTSDGVVLKTTTDRVKSHPVSNERLLTAAENAIGKENIAGYHKVSSSLDFTTMSLVTNKSFQPVDKDTLFGGIQIRNSILGKETVEVSPYVFRQWCTNGAITSESLGRFTRKRRDDDGIGDWMSEIIEGASGSLDHEFERIRQLTQVSVKGHLAEVLNGIRHDHGIPKKVMEDIQDEATAANAQTMYDVWNAITRVATHSDSLTAMSATRLQGIAGHVAKQNEVCPNCFRAVN